MKYKAIAIKQIMKDDSIHVGILQENVEAKNPNEAIGGAIQMSQFQGKEMKIGRIYNCETGVYDLYCAITIESVGPDDPAEYVCAYAVVPQEMISTIDQIYHLLELQNH